MHCEKLAYQELGLSKYAETCWELRSGEYSGFHEMFKQSLEYGWEHYQVIARFGRFPGRNKALERETTEEEKKYQEQGGRF